MDIIASYYKAIKRFIRWEALHPK